MGSAISRLVDIETKWKLIVQIIKDIDYALKSLAGFDWIDKAVEQLSKVSAEIRDEEKKTLQCINKTEKKIAIAVNDAKNVVSDVKNLCTTLNKVINSNAGGTNVYLIIEHIRAFATSMGDCLLTNPDNARDGLPKVTAEVKANFFKISNLKDLCFGRKQQLENAKNSSVVKVRVPGATVAAAGIVAAACWWNRVGWVAGIEAAGTAAVFALIIAGATECATIPQLKKMYDEGIKGLEESIDKFQDMSKCNNERTKSLTERLDHLGKITSFAHQVKANAKIPQLKKMYEERIKGPQESINKFQGMSKDIEERTKNYKTMFNILKEHVKELECLCDTYLKK